MGLDSYSDNLITINTVEKAKDAVVKVNSIVEGSLTQKQFNNHRKDVGYSSRANHFKQGLGMTFNEVKREAGIDINKNMQRCSDLPESMSRDKAYVYGVLLGDGSIYKLDERGEYVELAVKDREFAIKFGKSLCSLFNLEWRGWKDTRTAIQMDKKDLKDDNASDLYIVKKAIGQQNYNKIRADIKKTSDELLKQCSSNKVHILEGLWDSEGSIRSDSHVVRFSNTDDKILRLYIKLLEAVLDNINIGNIDKIRSNDLSKNIGDIRLDKETDLCNTNPKVDVILPAQYRCEFYDKLDICIQRKEDIFKEYCN